MLQVGGMQLFQAEAFNTAEKILPRANQISASLTGIYIFFTLLCTLAIIRRAWSRSTRSSMA